VAAVLCQTTVDVEPHRRLARAVEADAQPNGGGHVRRAYDEWLSIYRRFLRRRFDAASAGNGEFAPLAESTVRRKQSGMRTARRSAAGRFLPMGVYILRETETLYQALAASPGGGPGWYEAHIQRGVEAGYSGSALHPSGADRGLTVADLAAYHHDGGPRLPSRQIVTEPDEQAHAEMVEVMDQALRRAIEEAGAQ
jgi:hypothetical protein